MDTAEVTRLILMLFGGGALGAIVVKMLNREVDDATAASLYAQTATHDVQVLREVLTEVRANDAVKSQKLEDLEARVALLEERERHMLTRAAVHEAWDRMAFRALIMGDPAYPPPPPLGVQKTADDPANDHLDL